MRATNLEFRLRMWIMIVLIFAGFWAPWSPALGLEPKTTTLGWLALELARTGLVPFSVAAPAVVAFGVLTSAIGAWLRVWGAAYLGYTTVHHKDMQGSAMMADGPYRFLRNPLYLGGWFMVVAICLLMPVAGAPVSLVLMTVFFLRLILAEEAFLAPRMGQPYLDYLKAVPRLCPLPGRSLPPANHKPNWPVAAVTEVNPIGIFLAFAVLGWRYDIQLMLKAILVSFGLAMVLRGVFLNSKPTISTEA
jgi:protein-S-isoprenylcysteine O-methyltransferase Ste14